MELKQLEAALQSYKEKFGEYPPDFAGASVTGPAQDAVTRHLAKAFPRYAGNWQNDINSVLTATTGLANSTQLTPQTALMFWLGGIIDPATNTPSGFAADPTNPFQTPANCASRIKPFFDFDLTRASRKLSGGLTLCYWPQGAVGNTASTAGAIAYFRAENSYYTMDGTPSGTIKTVADASGATVYPAGDTRLGFPATATAWINPQSFQIFSSGLDVAYGTLSAGLQFPAGGNYTPHTFDDITNFSGGTLESAMP
jgi:hypothetical protein